MMEYVINIDLHVGPGEKYETISSALDISTNGDHIYIHYRPIAYQEKSVYHHNTYTSADGIIYQFNYMGKLRDGCDGNNLKDRSAGLIIRYNWIEDGNRQCDLVDGEDYTGFQSYHETFIYGNVLAENFNDGNRQMIHYGGDGGDESKYRQGTLYFHYNTIISTTTGRNTLFRLSDINENVDIRNNILYNLNDQFEISSGLNGNSVLNNNCIKKDKVVPAFEQNSAGSVTFQNNEEYENEPGWVKLVDHDYRIVKDSVCELFASIPLATEASSHYPQFQYIGRIMYEKRTSYDNVGGFEYGCSNPISNSSCIEQHVIVASIVSGVLIGVFSLIYLVTFIIILLLSFNIFTRKGEEK